MWSHEKLHLLSLELMRIAKSENIAFEIYGTNHTLSLHCPMTLSADKISWLHRKRNTVLRFNTSSKAVCLKHGGDESLFINKYGLDLKEYTLTPGSVPIQDEDGFTRAIITITGKTPDEDHEIAERAIEYLKGL